MKFLKESYPSYKYEELYYDNVEFDRYSGPIDYWSGDQRCDTIKIPHTYSAPVEEVKEFLAGFIPEDVDWEHVDEYLDEHYDDLLETHMEEVLEHFLEDAVNDAAENYDEGDWYDGPDRDEDY